VAGECSDYFAHHDLTLGKFQPRRPVLVVAVLNIPEVQPDQLTDLMKFGDQAFLFLCKTV
jgi:hypothetical protein